MNVFPQAIKSVKHMHSAKSVNRSILKKIRHLGFGVFIVPSSMGAVLTGRRGGGGGGHQLSTCSSAVYYRIAV